MNVETGIFSKRMKKEYYFCSVEDCSSRANKNFNLRFHNFPKPNKYLVKNKNLGTVDRFLVWKNLLKITKVNSRTRVCSLHFAKADYILPDIRSSQKQLKKTAIPTCNLPDPVMLTEYNDVQQLSSNSSSPEDESSSSLENTDEELSLNSPPHQDSPSSDDNIDKINSPPCYNDVIDLSVKLNSTDIIDQDNECQNTQNLFMCRTDAELKHVTGIESFFLLDYIVEIYENIPTLNHEKDMSIKEKIIRTCSELKKKKKVDTSMQWVNDVDRSMGSNYSLSIGDVNGVNVFDNSMESSGSSSCNLSTSSSSNNDYDNDANDVLNLSNTSSSDTSFQENDQVLDMSINTSYSRHIGVQINTGLVSPLFSLNTDAELSTATGIESFPILDFIVKVVERVVGSSNWHKNKRMSTREQIIMTYMKLKHNASYALLSLIFKAYSERHCQRVFKKMICILSKCLPRLAIRWPSREQNSRNIPKCFENFEDVIVIVDCTEIHMQVPPNLCCQLLTYSHYKGYNTFKFMTGVSPSGTITFISKAYGGRATDCDIFQDSGIMNLLKPGDAVMVDKGFLIDEICLQKNIKLIRPPFLKEKKQFSPEEAILTSKIATARVHIERSNQRIKNFDILGSILPSHLRENIDEIFSVICATVNLSSPILSDDKFIDH